MAVKRLNSEEVLSVCKMFIKGRGFACYFDLSDDIKKYLLMYNYIYTNEGLPDNYYFLDSKFYKNYKKIIEDLSLNRFEKELVKKYFALNIIYFDDEIMHLFLNNPKFHFSWDGYSGYLCSTADSKLDVYIKNICLAHDLEDNKVILGMFVVDLIDLPEQSQMILQPFMLEPEESRYEIHSYNIKNLYNGEFLDYDEESIYYVLLEGIKLINYIFESKYQFKLFKKEYEMVDLQFFMPLFYPTKINRFNFMMELLKITLDNINESKLKKKIKSDYSTMKNNTEFTLDDLAKEEFRSLHLFKTYFGQYDEFNDVSYEKLNEMRKMRTEPAHKVYKNDLDYSYCNEQDNLLKDTYRILCNIIHVEDPNSEYVKKYKDGIYECFFGKKGSIFESNGFNSKKYHYYNGFIRLLNDKFKVRDSEILFACHDINDLKCLLLKFMKSNTKINDKVLMEIIDSVLGLDICKPNEREIKSFFYGKSFINKMFGECGNYKTKGYKLYEDFMKEKYEYVFVFADSTDQYWSDEKTVEIIKDDISNVIGCGLIINSLSNCFAQDNTNIFNKTHNGVYISNNIWD